jgi:hypothetical protein
MFPEEKELRRQLAHRTVRSAEDVWPAVRPKLDTEDSGRRAAAWPAILAVVLVIVLLAALRGRSEHAERRLPGEDFAVTDVRSLGRPTTPIVLRPDSNTLMVVVD